VALGLASKKVFPTVKRQVPPDEILRDLEQSG